MISKEEFEHFWVENYNTLPPLGHYLRDYFFEDRWFRIHSLPNSKRYANNKTEMNTIIERQNTLIDDLIGENNGYVLLLYNFSELPIQKYCFDIHNAITLDTLEIDNDYYEDCVLNVAIISKIWHNRSLDNWLELIANDEVIISKDLYEVCRCLIIDINKNRIIAPYDGGVDVILNTKDERDSYKIKYQNWLSFREDGL